MLQYVAIGSSFFILSII